jgi:hypothetical protein
MVWKKWREKKRNAPSSMYAKGSGGGPSTKIITDAGSSPAASSFSPDARGPNANASENPGFAGQEKNGVALKPLLDCTLRVKHGEIATLLGLEWDDVTESDINLLDKFLGTQQIRTFRQVGGLSDDCVQDLRQSVPKPSVGTFANFLTLRVIFRPMVLQLQQGKRDEKYTYWC